MNKKKLEKQLAEIIVWVEQKNGIQGKGTLTSKSINAILEIIILKEQEQIKCFKCGYQFVEVSRIFCTCCFEKLEWEILNLDIIKEALEMRQHFQDQIASLQINLI